MNREVIGINLMAAAFTVWVAWRQGWLAWAWAFVVEYVRDGQPEQRTLDEYAHDMDLADDGLTIGEAIASVPELDLDGTQPFEQVFRDPPPGAPVLVPVQDAWVPVTYEPPVGEVEVLAAEVIDDLAASYLPFHPHTGSPAWRPRHAKTTWVDQLITREMQRGEHGAPSVEIYMWNWQQRHRLAVTA